MANYVPLIINPGSTQIQELPAGDNVDLASSNIANVVAITATGNVTAAYFVGDGSQLTNLPGGGGLPIANGTSNFDISTVNGNATITAGGAKTWTFDTTGNLNVPGNSFISTSAGNLSIEANGYFWRFNGALGNMTIPAGKAIRTDSGTNGEIILHPDGTGLVTIQGSPARLRLTSDTSNTQGGITIDNVGFSNAIPGFFSGRFARGNLTSLSALQSGDRISSFSGIGYDGVSYTGLSARMTVEAYDNWSAGNTPSRLSFYTTDYGANVEVINMQINPNGNVDIINGNINVTGGFISGNATSGTNALFSGIPGFTSLGSDVVAQFSANVNAYAQINFQNINSGNLSSTDYIATADNGTDSTYFVDLGIASSTHADPDFFGDTSTANDAYLYVVGTDATGPGGSGAGNLILGSTNGVIKMFVGNTAQANVVQTFSTTGVSVVGNISTTGNISASYFVGNGSQLTGLPASYSDSNVSSLLASFGSNTISTTGNVSVGNISAANLGNVSAINLDGNASTVLYGNGVFAAVTGSYGDSNVSTLLAAYGSNNISSTGNITSGNIATTGALSVTGNATVDGAGSNLIRKATVSGAANTAATLDNFEARLGGTPTRLYINTVSGTETLTGTSQTCSSGSQATVQWVNISVGAGSGNAFAMSGALTPSNGEMVVLNFTDQNAGAFMYRVTGIVANTTSGTNVVSIERIS